MKRDVKKEQEVQRNRAAIQMEMPATLHLADQNQTAET